MFVYFASTSDGRNLPHVSVTLAEIWFDLMHCGPPAPEHLPQQTAVPKQH